VVTLALLISWVVAVVFTPYLGVLLLPERKAGAAPHPHAHYDSRPYRMLRRVIAWSVEHRRLVVVATALLFVASVGGMGAVRQQFFPSSARPELLIDVKLRQGASHRATEAAVARVEAQLAHDPDVRWYTSYIGSGAPRFVLTYNPALPNDAAATIILTATDAVARNRVRDRLRVFLADGGLPQATARLASLELGPPVGFPVQFRVVGPDLAAVRQAADTALVALRDTPGARNAQLAWGERVASVHLVLDQPRIAALGLDPTTIADGLAAMETGLVATAIRDGTKRVDVVLRAIPSERLDLGRLGSMTLATPAGPVRLDQVARIEAASEEPILWRRNRDSYLTVQSDIQDGLQAPDVTAAARSRLDAIALPDGVRIETGAAAEESAKANVALVAVLPLMLGSMLLLLMIQLQNLPRTLLVVATAPLGVIGAVAGLLVTDAPFGFVALLGVIALAGMIMRNTVILVDQVRQDEAAGLSRRDAIVESTVRRARPVVLTALAAAFAFVPLGFNVFWGPMAIAMIGGLIVATVLTLVFLPALQALAFRVPRAARSVAVHPAGSLAQAD